MLVSGLFSAVGLLGAGWYIRRSLHRRRAMSGDAGDGASTADALLDRPARRFGAAIVGLLSIMFFFGVNFLDADSAPMVYILYWCVMSALVLWLCGLALADMLHTRKLAQRMLSHRDEQHPRGGTG